MEQYSALVDTQESLSASRTELERERQVAREHAGTLSSGFQRHVCQGMYLQLISPLYALEVSEG